MIHYICVSNYFHYGLHVKKSVVLSNTEENFKNMLFGSNIKKRRKLKHYRLRDPHRRHPQRRRLVSCDITAPADCMGGVYQSLNQRRDQVVEEILILVTPLNLVILIYNLI